jgi:hypothetical protein
MDKYIVYKTGSGLGPQSVRKSSIIEVRVIDCITRTPPPPPLGWSFFELAHGGVWNFHIAGHLLPGRVKCFNLGDKCVVFVDSLTYITAAAVQYSTVRVAVLIV